MPRAKPKPQQAPPDDHNDPSRRYEPGEIAPDPEPIPGTVYPDDPA